MVLNKFKFYIKGYFNALHLRIWLANLICSFLPHFFSGVIRARVYRFFGFRVGHSTLIMDNLELLSGESGILKKLKIGSNVLISSHVTINLDAEVTIEDNVTISPFVRIYTGTHKIGPTSNRCDRKPIASPIVIEHGSWIALGATILPGVRIGRGSVVAAGAVVTKDIPPNSLVTGVPAEIKNFLS